MTFPYFLFAFSFKGPGEVEMNARRFFVVTSSPILLNFSFFCAFLFQATQALEMNAFAYTICTGCHEKKNPICCHRKTPFSLKIQKVVQTGRPFFLDQVGRSRKHTVGSFFHSRLLSVTAAIPSAECRNTACCPTQQRFVKTHRHVSSTGELLQVASATI